MVLTDRGTTMKIMQVIPYFCFGGAETMCENLCYAQMALGHDVVAVSLYDERTPIAQRMEEAGIRILYLDKKLGLDVSMVPKLLGIMRREKPDVVHTHLDVIKYAVAAAKLAGIRSCVHTVHSVAHKEAEGRLQKIINGTYFRLKWSVPVALSPEVQQTICDFYGMKKKQVPVVFNGIDVKKCVPKTEYGFSETVQLVHVGRFDVPKNHEGMLRAFSILLRNYPQCCLHLVGDGELRPGMEKLVQELDITGSVVFHGMQSNVHPYLEQADIFLLPSRYEGMPMTIIEAMATGLPIVASRVGGIPDMLTDGESALLVDCEPESIVQGCEMMLQDEALRRKLGRNALAESSRFSAETMALCYSEVYKK